MFKVNIWQTWPRNSLLKSELLLWIQIHINSYLIVNILQFNKVVSLPKFSNTYLNCELFPWITSNIENVLFVSTWDIICITPFVHPMSSLIILAFMLSNCRYISKKENITWLKVTDVKSVTSHLQAKKNNNMIIDMCFQFSLDTESNEKFTQTKSIIIIIL